MLPDQLLSTHGGLPSGPGDLHSYNFDKSLLIPDWSMISGAHSESPDSAELVLSGYFPLYR